MNHRFTSLVLTGGLFVLCVALGGCDVQIDESILTAQANYDIDISLPYALLSLAFYSTGRKGDAEAILGKACALFPQNIQLQESLRRLLQT